jgi:quercetin dioxygenase-like cupin family protein
MSFGTHRATEGLDPSVIGFSHSHSRGHDGDHAHEHVLFDATEERIPRDPESEAWVFSGAIAPGSDTGWHIHNGVGYSIILKGAVRMESAEGSRVYRAGEAFTEPVGVVHRAVNIEPDTVMVAVQYQITPPDRPHTTEVAGYPAEADQ